MSLKLMDVVVRRREVSLKQADSPLASSGVKAGVVSAWTVVWRGFCGSLLVGKNYGTSIGVRKSLF